MPVGLSLKDLRVRRSISVREVERASARIAAAAGDVRFRISNGWLVQLEKGTSEPGICKLFSLSVIYQVRFNELVRLYDVDVDRVAQFAPIALPEETRLIASQQSSTLLEGYISTTDFTMYPMIRPGATVQIDTRRTKVIAGQFNNEHERPIYFIETRGESICGWCELQGKELLVIPHPASSVPIRRFSCPREAEIVGQVISFNTRCTNDPLTPHKNT